MPLSQVCLPEDDSGIHYAAFLDDQTEPIAVVSLFLEQVPSTIDNKLKSEENTTTQSVSDDPCRDANPRDRVIRFRKFACAPQYQGQGIGTQLLLHALSMARSEEDVTVAWCDARTSTMEWYKKRGLLPFGSTFYKGPVEYIRMQVDLRILGKNYSNNST